MQGNTQDKYHQTTFILKMHFNEGLCLKGREQKLIDKNELALPYGGVETKRRLLRVHTLGNSFCE